jgi:predicted CopG family antitoxin
MEPTVDDPHMGRTTIQVSDELADELYSRKSRGESYEEVIWRLLEETDVE